MKAAVDRRLAAAAGGWRLVGGGWSVAAGRWWVVAAFLDLLDVEFNIQHIFRTTLLWLLSEIVMFPVSSKFYIEQSKSPDIIDDTYTSNRRQREWISELIL